MKKMIKSLVAVAVLAAVSAGAQADMTLAVQSGTSYLPAVAGVLKFYKESGGTGEVKIVQTTSDEIQKGLSDGTYQFGDIGSSGAILQNAQTHGKVRILSGLSRGQTFLYCRKDANINSLADITPGLVIGTVGDEAIQTASLRMAALEKFGDSTRFNANFVKIKGGHAAIKKQMMLGQSEHKAGDVDCTTTSAPFSDQYRADHEHFVQVFSSHGLGPEGGYGDMLIANNPTFVVQAYNNDWCTKNDENVTNCVAMKLAVQKAQEWLGRKSHLDEAVQIFLKYPVENPLGKGFTEETARKAIWNQVKLNAADHCSYGEEICETSYASDLISVGQYAALYLVEGKIDHLPMAKSLAPITVADISLPVSEKDAARREAAVRVKYHLPEKAVAGKKVKKVS